MQSSPQLNVTPSMSTRSQDSGSHPSVFGPDELTVTPSTVTFVHRFGFMCQNGELMIVTPWMSTVSLANGWIICGGRKCPAPNTRWLTGTLSSAMVSSKSKSGVSRFFQFHQWFASAWPFSVPCPVIAMFRWP